MTTLWEFSKRDVLAQFLIYSMSCAFVWVKEVSLVGHVEFEAVSVTWKHGRGKELTVLAENAPFFSKCDHFFS